MKLIFLGSGSAFTVGSGNFQSNLLLESDRGQKLLLDCGSDIRHSLHAAGFSYTDITDVYISHLHSDHVGGLEYIGFNTKFDPHCQRPNLYLSKELAGDLWSHTLAGGMKSIEGDIADLETFFAVHKIERNSSFLWEGVQFNLAKVTHINNGYFVMPSYGVCFEIAGTKVFLTTDAQFNFEQFEPYYDWADLIFQDCETMPYGSPVHAHFEELRTLAKGIKRKMWLYGYQPGPLPDALAAGFQGFVQRGQVFEFSGNLQAAAVSRGSVITV